MLFLPLGALWRWACGHELARSLPARILIVLLILAIGLAIELGQAFMVRQYADSTDLLIYPVGAAIGWSIWGLIFRESSSDTI